MKNIFAHIILLLFLILTGCFSSGKLDSNRLLDISKKTFIFESNIRTITIFFDSSDCQISNVYKCPAINNNYKKINISCSYLRLNDSMLILQNKLYNTTSDLQNLTPPKEELDKCLSSPKEVYKNKLKVDAWSNDDGFIPVIDIDTLKILSKNNKTLLYLSKKRDQTIYNFFWKEK